MRTENVFGRDHSNLCPVLAQAVYKSCLSCLHYSVSHTAGIPLVPGGVGDGGFSANMLSPDSWQYTIILSKVPSFR